MIFKQLREELWKDYGKIAEVTRITGHLDRGVNHSGPQCDADYWLHSVGRPDKEVFVVCSLYETQYFKSAA